MKKARGFVVVAHVDTCSCGIFTLRDGVTLFAMYNKTGEEFL